MSNFTKVRLGDVLEIKHGYAFKSENYVPKSQYALITLANISDSNNFKIDWDKTTYYGASFPEQFILEPQDLVMPLTEQVIGLFGNTAFIPYCEDVTFVLNQRVGKVVPKIGKADKYYLHFLLATEMVKKQLEYRASGTRQRNISPDDVYDVVVYLPDLETQEKVGKTLYLIEQKINNNNSINNVLSDMSFDFFYYYFGKKQPNGKLKDILIEHEKSTIQVGYAKGVDGEIPFFTSGEAILQWKEALCSGRNCLLNTGGNADIKYYVGPLAYSTDTWCITGKKGYEDYLYLLLSSIKSELEKKYFQGTGLKHLQKELLREKDIYIPSREEILTFNSSVSAFLTAISSNTRENQKLNSMKSDLLPLLMNGQVSIL